MNLVHKTKGRYCQNRFFKNNPIIYYLQEIYFIFKDTNRFKGKSWLKIHLANSKQKKPKWLYN